MRRGKTYRYKLEAVSPSGQSEWSDVLEVTVPFLPYAAYPYNCPVASFGVGRGLNKPNLVESKGVLPDRLASFLAPLWRIFLRRSFFHRNSSGAVIDEQ